MQMAQVFELVREDLQKVDAECRRNIASEGGLIAHVGEYIILSGGKRIRPMLLLLCARLCGYQGERQIPIGTVLEFIHTATLLHDDVIDQATQRRGNPSAHTIWGSTASVLVGDFLFAKAFHLMVQDGDLRILNILSEMTTRIARGEIHELVKSYDVTLGEEEYLEIIRDKTACLFSAACQIGGVLGGVSPERVDALAGLGMRLGMAFQLVDDTLDYTPAGEGFGKDPGTDLREGKVTLPLIYTLQKCTAEERERIASIIGGDEEIQPGGFQATQEIITKWGGVDYTMEQARRYVEEAKGLLALLPPARERDALLAVADYIVERKA